MDDVTKKKLQAAATIAMGGGRIVSGALMAAGRGLVGANMRHSGHMKEAIMMGVRSMQAGKDKILAGLAAWHKASAVPDKEQEGGPK